MSKKVDVLYFTLFSVQAWLFFKCTSSLNIALTQSKVVWILKSFHVIISIFYVCTQVNYYSAEVDARGSSLCPTVYFFKVSHC
jgi:hypothetical protein